MDPKSSKEVLNLISALTGLSISVHSKYYNIYSDDYFPDFCKYIREINPTICSNFHSTNEPSMCPAGLWRKIFKIETSKSDDDFGYLIIGHRRLKGKDHLSLARLNDLLCLYGLSQFNKIHILNSFDRVEIVEEAAFNNNIIDKLLIMCSKLLDNYKDTESKIKNETNAELMARIAQDQAKKEHELAERERKRVNELNILAAKVAHEVQLPIQAMVGIAENLYNELTDDEQKLMAHSLLKNLIKLSLIADNLKNIEKPSDSYIFNKVNYIELLNQSLALFRRDAEKKGIAIGDIEIIGDPPRSVLGSELHLKQVFFNIINNALKYSLPVENDKYNVISIKCRNFKKYISIEISNYGIGILEKEIKSGLIFQCRYRGELAQDRVRIGSGLGLYISKKIIEDHKGKIKIKSKKMDSTEKHSVYFTEIKILLPKDKKVIADGE